jgi:hypothetical protein
VRFHHLKWVQVHHLVRWVRSWVEPLQDELLQDPNPRVKVGEVTKNARFVRNTQDDLVSSTTKSSVSTFGTRGPGFGDGFSLTLRSVVREISHRTGFAVNNEPVLSPIPLVAASERLVMVSQRWWSIVDRGQSDELEPRMWIE